MKFGDEVVLIRGSRGRGPESGPGFERRLRANGGGQRPARLFAQVRWNDWLGWMPEYDTDMREQETMDVSGEGLYRHRVGDAKCSEGWCDGHQYPKPCPCGGLIHADFGDEDANCNYWLYTKCDKCGEPE